MFNWREVPFVRLLIPLAIGIAMGLYFNTVLHLLNVVILLLFFSIALLANRKLETNLKNTFSLFVHCTLLVIGYQLAIYQNDFHSEKHFRNALPNSDVNTLLGTVEDIKSSGRFLSVKLTVDQINIDQKPKNACGSIMLSIDQAELREAPAYGDRLVFSAKVKELEAPKNPAAFDYRFFLRMKGVYHQAFVKKENWDIVASNRGNPIIAQTSAIRKGLIKALKIYLPTENEFAVGAAMLLGFRDGMNEEIKNAYAGTGATHVMAVSGLHIGLVFLGLGLLLRLLFWRNKFMRFFKPAAMLGGIWLFALISGASPSAMRAAFMFSLIIIAQSLNREGSIYNTLASSAFCLLVFNPFLLMEVGFQLSYLAVGGIVYFQPKIYKLWYIENRLGKYIWQMASVGLAAQLMTFPLSIFYFHQFPVYFWLSGLIVVPAATVIIALGALLFFSHYYVGFLSPFIGKLLWWMISIMNGLIFLIRKLPAGLIEGIWIGAGVFVLLYLIISTVVIAINSKQLRWAIYSLGLFVLVMGATAFTNIQQQDQTTIVFYHSPKNTLVDFVSGNSVITLHNESLSAKKEKQAAENYRSSINSDKVVTLLLESNNACSNGPLKYQQPFVQFYDTRIAFIDVINFQLPNTPIEIDYLFLHNKAKYSIEELKQHFNFKNLVIGTTNYKKQTEQWITTCQKENIPYHSIYEKGALLVDLQKSKPSSK
ncbi:MAG: ComEC/Rec2 family competence protein [Saprospiraceae bacterium]